MLFKRKRSAQPILRYSKHLTKSPKMGPFQAIINSCKDFPWWRTCSAKGKAPWICIPLGHRTALQKALTVFPRIGFLEVILSIEQSPFMEGWWHTVCLPQYPTLDSKITVLHCIKPRQEIKNSTATGRCTLLLLTFLQKYLIIYHYLK